MRRRHRVELPRPMGHWVIQKTGPLWSELRPDDERALLRLFVLRARSALNDEISTDLDESQRQVLTRLIDSLAPDVPLSTEQRRQLVSASWELFLAVPVDGFGVVGMLVELVDRAVELSHAPEAEGSTFADAVEGWVHLAGEWFLEQVWQRGGVMSMSAEYEVQEALHCVQHYAMLMDIEWLLSVRSADGQVDPAAVVQRAERFSVASECLVRLL